MNSLSEIVEVVIGVDTHEDRHLEFVHPRTGAVLQELTVPTTPEGYQDLVKPVDSYSLIPSWAVEGTGGHGAGLARRLSSAARRPSRGPDRHTGRALCAKDASDDQLDNARAVLDVFHSVKLVHGVVDRIPRQGQQHAQIGFPVRRPTWFIRARPRFHHTRDASLAH